MVASIQEKLDRFQPGVDGRYDAGKIIILFDNRVSKSTSDQFSFLQNYYTDSMYKLGWPSAWYLPGGELEPGNIRLVFYTHSGNQGTRDYPLHRAEAVKEMFDSLSDEGFRPMVLGWSAENPYPMIGGTEPPPAPEKPKIKVATSWSGTVSGHGDGSNTPLDRVMAIIGDEERQEAEWRKRDIMQGLDKEKKEIASPV